MKNKIDFIIIGASILDVLAQPVPPDVFETGSVSAAHTAMHTGGDALNEAAVLAALGSSVRLVSKIGTDYAGNYIKTHCRSAGMDTSYLLEDASLETGVNLVLVDDSGESGTLLHPRMEACGNCIRKIFLMRRWLEAGISVLRACLSFRHLTTLRWPDYF